MARDQMKRGQLYARLALLAAPVAVSVGCSATARDAEGGMRGAGMGVEPGAHAARRSAPLVTGPGWSPAGAIGSRGFHSATLLASGKVLVAGGYFDDDTADAMVYSTAELYDPAAKAWSAAAAMSGPRHAHGATLLADGKVLVAGGSDGVYGMSTAERYDPSTNTWSAAAPLMTARVEHRQTLLADGRVLVAGGRDAVGLLLSTAERYDPATNTWSAAGTTTKRRGHSATLLPNGKVLVAGGTDYFATFSTADLYDPLTNTWSAATAMSTKRRSHTATLMPSGQVLVAGGFVGNDPGPTSSTVELYDPLTNTWSSATEMDTTRGGHSATPLVGGKVLVAGGFDGFDYLSTAEVYDPSTDVWSGAGAMSAVRGGHSDTLLTSGNVLVVGGGYGTGLYLSTAEIFAP